MKAFFKHSWLAMRVGTSGLVSIAVWSLWLALGAVLSVQLWWVASRELAVPDFVLRSLEKRLAASQLHATFGRTLFDPSGRVLVEQVRLTAEAFSEPLATADVVYVRLDPWALLAGRFEPAELQLSGVSLFVPAMLSASGKSEPIIRDLDATLAPGERKVDIRQLNARIGGLFVTALGEIPLPAKPTGGTSPLPIAEFISHTYPALSREIADQLTQLAPLKEPELHLEISPGEKDSLLIDTRFLTRLVTLATPFDVEASDVVATTRVTFSGNTLAATQLDVESSSISLPRSTILKQVNLRAHGTLTVASKQRVFQATDADISADAVTTGVIATPIAALALHLELPPEKSPLRGSFVALLGDAPVTVGGDADPTAKTANLHVNGIVTPILLEALIPVTNPVLRTLVKLTSPASVDGDAHYGAGWTFASLDARASAAGVSIRDVPIDSVSGRITLAGTSLQATDVVLHQGANVARGSYLTDTATHDYRFLVKGRLRPLDISGWFGAWWKNLFSELDFTAAPPDADVDVQGRWGNNALSTVFIGVDAASPAIRGVHFDRVRTVLFIRQDYVEAREFLVTLGAGSARGTFTRVNNSQAGAFRDIDFAVASTLDLRETARVIGPAAENIVQPYKFATPPAIKAHGHLTGAGSDAGTHHAVSVEGESRGGAELFGFPLDNVSFAADVGDDVISVTRADVDIAGGHGSGSVRLTGHGTEQRLSFDYSVKDASLGRAITTIREFIAMRKNSGPLPKSPFADKELHIDLKGSAEGMIHDLFSYHGTGEADISGPTLGEIPLLGSATALIPVASIHFTKLHTPIKLDGAQLSFSKIELTGSNSELDATGSYAMDRDALDFNVNVYPFEQSRNIVQRVVGVLTDPLSEILEVKLTGPLGKPDWAFVAGPTNFLRILLGRSANDQNAGDTPPLPAQPAQPKTSTPSE